MQGLYTEIAKYHQGKFTKDLNEYHVYILEDSALLRCQHSPNSRRQSQLHFKQNPSRLCLQHLTSWWEFIQTCKESRTAKHTYLHQIKPLTILRTQYSFSTWHTAYAMSYFYSLFPNLCALKQSLPQILAPSQSPLTYEMEELTLSSEQLYLPLVTQTLSLSYSSISYIILQLM